MRHTCHAGQADVYVILAFEIKAEFCL